jgi:hypothetical protein
MPRKLTGKGYWEDEYNRRANLIPGVNQRLLAEIGTDLKNRLSKLYSSKFTAPFLKPFGIDTRKEALVKEAIATLTRLTNENPRKGFERVTEGKETWLYNPVTKQSFWEDELPERTLAEKIADSRTTGRLGQPVVRENLPKYKPITELTADATTVYTRDSPLIKTDYPKQFKVISLNEGINGPIPWGKFNTVFVKAHHPGARSGHVAVLIRNLTDPISYTWYDSHGTSWRDEGTHFYRWREILNRIVGDSPVNFNDVEHQCNNSLCQTFAKIRATYANLTNEQYAEELRRTAEQIARDPTFYVENIGMPLIGPNREVEAYAPVRNTKQLLGRYARANLEVIPPNMYGFEAGDVYAAPLVANKVNNNPKEMLINPQQEVPFSTARPLPAPAPVPANAGRGRCQNCGLPKRGGTKASGYVQRLIAEEKLNPRKVKNPSAYIKKMKMNPDLEDLAKRMQGMGVKPRRK